MVQKPTRRDNEQVLSQRPTYLAWSLRKLVPRQLRYAVHRCVDTLREWHGTNTSCVDSRHLQLEDVEELNRNRHSCPSVVVDRHFVACYAGARVWCRRPQPQANDAMTNGDG